MHEHLYKHLGGIKLVWFDIFVIHICNRDMVLDMFVLDVIVFDICKSKYPWTIYFTQFFLLHNIFDEGSFMLVLSMRAL